MARDARDEPTGDAGAARSRGFLRDPHDDDRRTESEIEKHDRHWSELLAELRVTQTGVQVLTGFLLVVPFQAAFADVDAFQHRVYLVLVVLAVVTAGLNVAPVSLHRVLFGEHLRAELVRWADLLARVGLATLALVLAGTLLLIFDVVVDRAAGLVVGSIVLAFLVLTWWVLPWELRRRGRRERAGT